MFYLPQKTQFLGFNHHLFMSRSPQRIKTVSFGALQAFVWWYLAVKRLWWQRLIAVWLKLAESQYIVSSGKIEGIVNRLQPIEINHMITVPHTPPLFFLVIVKAGVSALISKNDGFLCRNLLDMNLVYHGEVKRKFLFALCLLSCTRSFSIAKKSHSVAQNPLNGALPPSSLR